MKILNSIFPPLFGLGRLAIPMALAIMTLVACTKKKELAPVVRPVRSVVVENRAVGDPIAVTGHLRARNEVNLAFRIGGRLIERKVGVGDMVQAGQTVALLDAEVERNTRNTAQADVAAAQAALEQSEANERRQKNLLTQRAISQSEYEVALRQLKTTQAQLDATAARLKSAAEQVSYTELKSDAAGVITEKGAEVGEVVPAGKMVLQVAQQTGRDAVFPTCLPRLFATACRWVRKVRSGLRKIPISRWTGRSAKYRRRPIRSHATIRSRSNSPIRRRECSWEPRSSGV
jgi:multidrug efflux pump subunit AcrA (membrane-fusion protein)